MKSANVLVLSSSVVSGALRFTCHGVRKKERTGWLGRRDPEWLLEPPGHVEWSGAKGGGTLKAEKPEEALQYLVEGTDEGPCRALRMSEHGDMPVATTGTSTEDWGGEGGCGIRALTKTKLSDYTNADHRRLNNPQETGQVLSQRGQWYLGITEGELCGAW